MAGLIETCVKSWSRLLEIVFQSKARRLSMFTYIQLKQFFLEKIPLDITFHQFKFHIIYSI